MTPSKRQLWLATIASTAATLGSAVLGFGLSLYLLEKTGSSISFALSVVIQPLVGLLLMPIVGPFVDRHSRKMVIGLSQLVSILALIVFAAVYAQTKHLMLLCVLLLIVLRASDQFTQSAQTAAKINLVDAEDLQALAGYEQAGQSLSGIFASMLAAALYAILPFSWLIIMEVACEALALGLTLMLNFNLTGKLSPTKASGSHWTQLRAGFAYLKKRKALSVFIGIAAVTNLLGTIDVVGLPMLVIHTMHLEAWRYALGDGAFGVGTLVASIQLSKRPQFEKPLLHVWHYCMLFGLWIALLATVGALHRFPTAATVVLVVLEVAMGWNQNWLNIPLSVWMQETVPPQLQGRVFSLLTTVVMAAMPLGVGLFTLGFAVKPMNVLIWQPLLFVLAGVTLSAMTFLVVRLWHVNLNEA